MKRGLTLTLMTVAIAMLGFQAMAMAPIINEVPSPIVGNAGAPTGPNQFVFPDAIDLTNYVSDDNVTSAAQIKWSYVVDETGGAVYRINGVDPVDGSSVAENTNPGAKQINNQVLKGETDGDSNPNTITVRNVRLSPLQSQANDTIPGTQGILGSDTRIVTLIASDGTTYSQKDVFFYTRVGGDDALSPESVIAVKHDFTQPGVSTLYSSSGSGVTFSVSAKAICMNTFAVASTAKKRNVGQWSTKTGEPFFEVLDNQVYRIRAMLNGTQTTSGKTPLWDMSIANLPYATYAADGKTVTGFHGWNAYGCDAYFFDNQGGANSVLSTANGTEYDIWWAPAAIATPQWKAAAFAAGKEPEMRNKITFRLLDTTDNPALSAWKNVGSVCLEKLTVERYGLSTMKKLANVFSVTSLKKADDAVPGNVRFQALFGSTADFTGGVMTIKSGIKGSTKTELINIFPSKDLKSYEKGATGDDIADDFPIEWKANTLYQMTVDMAAADDNGQANPPDAFFMNFSEPTNEVLYTSMVSTGGGKIAMPKTGDPQTYMAFFYSHTPTKSTAKNFNRIRPTLQFASNQNLTQGDNSGSLKISKWEVNEVKF